MNKAIVIWIVVNLLTAAVTQLHPDEAYYWVYSRFLDWGYFDHPPMIAFMTRIGYALIPTELGVRLIVILMVGVSLMMILKLNSRFASISWVDYALLLFSIVSLTAIGFTNTPDGYLLFFTCIYVVLVKKFLEDESSFTWPMVFGWGFIMSAMLYSKYHGILVIGFTALSNPRILTSKKFWSAGVFGAILFIPHLWWQYSNSFPSIQYHFVDRSQSSYQLKYSTEYILGQLFYYGPFTGFLMYFCSYKVKTENNFERFLKVLLYGFLSFFLIMTFQGRIEANWTLVIIIPLLYFTLKYLYSNQDFKKTFRWIVIPGVIILFIARIQILYPILDVPGDRTNELRGHKEFAENVEKLSGELPVAANTYQTASILSFYSPNLVTSLNVNSRKNQYDFWSLDQNIYPGPFYFINNHLEVGDSLVDNRGNKLMGTRIERTNILRGVFLNLDANMPDQNVVRVNIKFHKKYVTLLGLNASLIEILQVDEGEEKVIGTKRINKRDLQANEYLDILIDEAEPNIQELKVQLRTPGLGIWYKGK